MALEITNLDESIRHAKMSLKNRCVRLKKTYMEYSDTIERDINDISLLRENHQPVIPEVDFQRLKEYGFSPKERTLIHQRGCVIVRNTFAREQAEEWNNILGHYLADNGYYEMEEKGLDEYFSSLQTGKPQIFDVYWSLPQVQARQSSQLAVVRQALNHLWDFSFDGRQVFDPDRECTYADRTRRREPGDASLGLKPHVDGGTVERWLDTQGFQGVYRQLIAGDWQAFDPFEAGWRTRTEEIASPAVCSMFRTWQGWTALTGQGPGDGTLQLVPLTRGLGWMFLRALQDDVADDDLCGAAPGRALQCDPAWHELLLRGLCTIPVMNPGDSVWWHPDVVHAVENKNSGQGYSNVIYIGAAPHCAKNTACLSKQALCFEQGRSAPDFAAADVEVNYKGRATPADLTELGARQMGILAW